MRLRREDRNIVNIVRLSTDDARTLYRQIIKSSGGSLDTETFAAVSRLADMIAVADAVPSSELQG
jgi:hypothetical protein